MLKPYKIIEESESSTTYQYNALYSWLLLAILAVLFVGIFLNHEFLLLISAVLTVIYFGVKLALGSEVNKIIKKATKSGWVEISGSNKYSFSNPIKVKVTKNA